MSLVTLANTCAHLQNVGMAKLPLTSIPFTRLQLQLALNLHREGFLSSVQRGSTTGPDLTPVEVTADNVSSRRLWLALKYRQNKPVLSKLQLISKPNRRLYASAAELREFANGNKIRQVTPIMPGEVVFVRPRGTKDIVNIHEAVQKDLDGELLCRVY